jgi:cobalt-zinc-cadmium efflux system outer membrane protein
MHFRIGTVLGAVGLGLVGSVGGEPGRGPGLAPTNLVLTLEAAVRVALAGNPEVRAGGARVDAAAGRARQARRWTNPELALSAEDWPTEGGGFSDAKQLIGVEQVVPYPGKKGLDRRIGVAGVRMTEAELGLRRVELVREVKAAFFQVLAAERSLEVAAELTAVAESSAATAARRVAAGAAADQEQLRAEIVLEQARAEFSGFERDRWAARETLAMLLGRPEWREAEVRREIVGGGGPDPGGAGSRALAGDASGGGGGPGWPGPGGSRVSAGPVGAVSGRAFRRGGGTGGFERRLDRAVRVFVAAADHRSVAGRQQESEANVAVAEAEVVAIENRLLRAWGTASARFRTAVRQVESYRERILPKAGEALRLVRRGFEEGKFGLIDLLDTQRTAAEARLAYQQKLLELNLAEADLEALVRPPVSETSTRP